MLPVAALGPASKVVQAGRHGPHVTNKHLVCRLTPRSSAVDGSADSDYAVMKGVARSARWWWPRGGASPSRHSPLALSKVREATVEFATAVPGK